MLKKPVILTFEIPEKWEYKVEIPKTDKDDNPIIKNGEPVMEEVITEFEFGSGQKIKVTSLTGLEITEIGLKSQESKAVGKLIDYRNNPRKLMENVFCARVLSGEGFTDYDGELIKEFGLKWKKIYAVEPGYFEFVNECGKYCDAVRDKADEADLKNFQVSPLGVQAGSGSGKIVKAAGKSSPKST